MTYWNPPPGAFTLRVIVRVPPELVVGLGDGEADALGFGVDAEFCVVVPLVTKHGPWLTLNCPYVPLMAAIASVTWLFRWSVVR